MTKTYNIAIADGFAGSMSEGSDLNFLIMAGSTIMLMSSMYILFTQSATIPTMIIAFIGGALAPFLAPMIWLWDKFMWLIDAGKGFLKKIGEMARGIFDFLKNMFTKGAAWLLDAIKKGFVFVISNIFPALSAIWNIVKWIGGLPGIRNVIGIISKIGEHSWNFLKASVDFLKAPVENTIKGLQNIGSGLGNIMKPVIGGVSDVVGKVGSYVMDLSKKIIGSKAVESIKNFIISSKKRVTDITSPVTQKVGEIAKNVGGVLSEIGKKIDGFFGNVIGKVKDTASSIAGAITQATTWVSSQIIDLKFKIARADYMTNVDASEVARISVENFDWDSWISQSGLETRISNFITKLENQRNTQEAYMSSMGYKQTGGGAWTLKEDYGVEIFGSVEATIFNEATQTSILPTIIDVAGERYSTDTSEEPLLSQKIIPEKFIHPAAKLINFVNSNKETHSVIVNEFLVPYWRVVKGGLNEILSDMKEEFRKRAEKAIHKQIAEEKEKREKEEEEKNYYTIKTPVIKTKEQLDNVNKNVKWGIVNGRIVLS